MPGELKPVYLALCSEYMGRNLPWGRLDINAMLVLFHAATGKEPDHANPDNVAARMLTAYRPLYKRHNPRSITEDELREVVEAGLAYEPAGVINI